MQCTTVLEMVEYFRCQKFSFFKIHFLDNREQVLSFYYFLSYFLFLFRILLVWCKKNLKRGKRIENFLWLCIGWCKWREWSGKQTEMWEEIQYKFWHDPRQIKINLKTSRKAILCTNLDYYGSQISRWDEHNFS